MARFCWRERTERVNWRMLKDLQLTDVVRRGDPTLLEPYTLHLTFAKLPVVVTSLRPSKSDIYEDDMEPSAGGRNAWFLVRVFQLAMEYLLFLRARDGTVVDSLREELQACGRECELLMERAKKWKERAKSSDRQTDKLHHVLQGIAKLLQIEGATPSAVTTIEELLRDFKVTHSGGGGTGKRHAHERETQVEEARVCTLCGKMFSSQEFLEKHTVRRHAGQEAKVVRAGDKKPIRQAWRQPPDNNDGVEDAVGDQITPASGVKEMLRVVEQTLFEHQAALRNVAQEEADKIHNLYEQLHVETQLVEEMRAKRAAIEKEIQQSRRELDGIQQEKADTVEDIRAMKEQLQFLEMKRKIQMQNGGSSNEAAHASISNTTLQLELKRLESTITVLKDALATSREELQRTQASYGVLLKEKQRLEAHAPVDRSQPPPPAPEAKQTPMTRDVGCQASVASTTAASQTEDVPAAQMPAAPAPKRVEAGDAAVQTEQLAAHVDEIVQTDPVVVPVVEVEPPQATLEPAKETTVEGPKEADEAIFQLHCRSISDAIQRRALRYAHTKPSPSDEKSDEKLFSSLPRRRFLRSRFLHDESAVKDRIAAQVSKLEQTSQRYGVPPKSSVLANEHVEVVQRALHAHLEVLPVEVLQRMIDVENQVNALITSEWMPNEKSRQQALEVLTANRAVKNQRNELLIRQAMGALVPSAAEKPLLVTGASGPPEDHTTLLATVQDADVEDKQVAAEPVVRAATPPVEEYKAQQREHIVAASPFAAVPVSATSLPAASVLPEVREDVAVPEPRQMPNLQITIDPPPFVTAKPESDAVSYLVGEPSPETVQDVRRQAIAVRSVKSVSVSPRSSPPKASPPRVSLMKTSPPKTSLPKESSPTPSSPPSPREEKATESASVAMPMPARSDEPRRYGRDRDDYRGATTERMSVVFSDVASSEMSLGASIPSLATDATSDAGFSASQSFAKSSIEDLPALQDDSEQFDGHPTQLMSLEDDDTPTSYSEPIATPHQTTQVAPDSRHSSPRLASSPSNEIMAFDDSDIEEVMLS